MVRLRPQAERFLAALAVTWLLGTVAFGTMAAGSPEPTGPAAPTGSPIASATPAGSAITSASNPVADTPVASPTTAPAGAATPAPSATPAVVLAVGDPRSEGEGPGLVGNPLTILAAVVLLGLATAAFTLVLARLLRPR